MTKILIDKDVKNIVGIIKYRMIKSALKFSINYHGLKDYQNNTKIYFFVENNTIYDKNGNECHGTCSNYLLKNKLSLVVRNDNIFKMISYIFHEMTHVKQFIKNEISYTPFGKAWKDEEYIYNYFTGEKSEYWNSPHEIDARNHQKMMMRKWIISNIKNFFKLERLDY